MRKTGEGTQRKRGEKSRYTKRDIRNMTYKVKVEGDGRNPINREEGREGRKEGNKVGTYLCPCRM